jgi:hypothetical protein
MKPCLNIPNLLILVLLLTGASIKAQTVDSSSIPMPLLGPNDTIPVPAMIMDNEWIPGNNLQWHYVHARYPKHLLKKKQAWTRLRNAVYVTYPYARKAGAIMNDMNMKLAQMPDKEQRRRYIKSREKELKKEFADPLTELSVYQGKVLMKLINRQTGNNCYDLVKEYKGGFSARFWQTIAFVFGSSLKQPYEAREADREIELIVREVERMYPPMYN